MLEPMIAASLKRPAEPKGRQMNELFNPYQLFFEADLTKLPTEVLHSIRIALEKEIRDRIDGAKAASHLQRNVLGRFNKQIRRKFHGRLFEFLGTILDEDWTPLFKGDAERKYYVYAHVNPSKKLVEYEHPKCHIKTLGVPFYIGKGTGSRAYDLSRNEGHGVILRQLKEKGKTSDDIVFILKEGLTEPESLALESQLIYFFGTKFDKRQGILVNLEIPPRPYP